MNELGDAFEFRRTRSHLKGYERTLKFSMDSTMQTDKSDMKSSGLAMILKAFEANTSKKNDFAGTKSFATHLNEKASAIRGLSAEHEKTGGDQNLNNTHPELGSSFKNNAEGSMQTLPETNANKSIAAPLTEDAAKIVFMDNNTGVSPADLLKNIISPDVKKLSGQNINKIIGHMAIDQTNASEESTEVMAAYPFISNAEIMAEGINRDALPIINPVSISETNHKGEADQYASDRKPSSPVIHHDDQTTSVDKDVESPKDVMAGICFGTEDKAVHLNQNRTVTAKMSDDLKTAPVDGKTVSSPAIPDVNTIADQQASNDDFEIDAFIKTLAVFLRQEQMTDIRDKTVTDSTKISEKESRFAASEPFVKDHKEGLLSKDQFKLLKDVLKALVAGDRSETLSASQTIDNGSEKITATASANSKQRVSLTDHKQERLIAALEVLLTGRQGETASSGQNKENITAHGEAADRMTPYEIKNSINGHEKIKEAFVSRLAEFLENKGDKDGSITEMITRVKNLAGTAQNKTTHDFSAKAATTIATETAIKDASIAGSKAGNTQLELSPDSEKRAQVRNTMLNPLSEENAKIISEALPEAQQSVQRISRTKVQDHSPIMAEREASGVTSSFSDLLTTQAKSPQSVRLQSMIEQIALAKQQMGSDGGRVKITLNPPNLGNIDLEVIVRQNKVEITMIADHASAQQLLQSHSDEVKSALQRQDMKIENFQVFLQNNHDGNHQPSGHWTSMENRNQWESRRLAHQEETADKSFVREEISTRPVQGLVSVFA